MALVNLWNINSFGKVATLYESTKPLVSKCHTREQDIRPIGDRARKYERIKKINDNCYVLMDGYYTGDDVFLTWYGSVGGKPTEAEVIKLAPIVWRKHRDGSETLTVRNATGVTSAHTSRYSFLQRCLPRGIGFSIDQGKQFIHCRGERYYLAKSNTVAAFAVPTGTRNRWTKDLTSRDDGVALTFRFKDHDVSYDSGGKPKPIPPVQRIDKLSKTKMKPYLDKFRQWAFTMAPLWDYGSRDQVRKVNQEVSEYVGNDRGWFRSSEVFKDNPKLSREIIKDEEHPLRVALAFTIINDTHYDALTEQGGRRYMGYDNVTESSVKAQYNAKINQVCGFIKIKKGKK